MSWHPQPSPAWADPLDIARAFSDCDMALLYSGLSERFSGNISYLFLEPHQVVEATNWSELPCRSDDDGGASDLPQWVGYVGYEMGDDVPIGTPSFIAMPRARFIRYGHLFRFNHRLKTIDYFTQSDVSPISIPSIPTKKTASGNGGNGENVVVQSLRSNFSRASYESCIARTVAEIQAGNFYQANITRKFFGEFTTTPTSWALYEKLCRTSPSPYSAYLRHGDSAILSSSPECFLNVDGSGGITTRPIKGSARRNDDAARDAAIKTALQNSVKNHAEHLMIVDLMRHDLSQVSLTGSVAVPEQAALYSYATIHHLISTIQAKKQPNLSACDVAKACFPPGSMTGAPKIAAMRWCAQQEQMQRGVYSGAIGWFGSHQNCDLSVVIRTLVIEKNRFEFQVGGGIVADSTPFDEWQETLTKARAVAGVLGLTEDDLAGI
jgi:anthranilate/para-aminobenzoate synthase component I